MYFDRFCSCDFCTEITVTLKSSQIGIYILKLTIMPNSTLYVLQLCIKLYYINSNLEILESFIFYNCTFKISEYDIIVFCVYYSFFNHSDNKCLYT